MADLWTRRMKYFLSSIFYNFNIFTQRTVARVDAGSIYFYYFMIFSREELLLTCQVLKRVRWYDNTTMMYSIHREYFPVEDFGERNLRVICIDPLK